MVARFEKRFYRRFPQHFTPIDPRPRRQGARAAPGGTIQPPHRHPGTLDSASPSVMSHSLTLLASEEVHP